MHLETQSITRRGEYRYMGIRPEGLPQVLGNYTFPKKWADQLAKADAAVDALIDAHTDWSDARDEFEHYAPARDQKALEDAIRAGDPDPGTPETDAADRAEHVAWTRLQMAITDASKARGHRDVIGDYLAAESKALAKHELAREEAHTKASEKARALIEEAEDRSNAPGAASAAMHALTAERWEPDADTLLTPSPNADRDERAQINQRNAAILERWKRQAGGEPEPGHDAGHAEATRGTRGSGVSTTSAEARNRSDNVSESKPSARA